MASAANSCRSADHRFMSSSKPEPQTAAARRTAEAEVRLLIDMYAASHLRLIGALRRSLQKRLPTAHEIVYEYRDFFVISYSPNEHGYEGVLGIRASADCVSIFLNQGPDLPDPEKLLKGTGKQTRSLDVEGAATLRRPAVANLIDEAIARCPVPFASTGRGSVIIRPTTAKKNRERRTG
jgi:hypothetical protein